MKHQNPTSLRKIIIALSATAAVFAVTLGLPIKKTFAGSPNNGAPNNGAPGNGAPGNGAPGNGAPGNGQPKAGGGSTGVGVDIDISRLLPGRQKPRQVVVQPVPINPTAVHLVKIANEALTDPALAEHIFHEPDVVASQNRLSENETKVLRKMTPEQFATAREDAAHVAAKRLADAGVKGQPTQDEVNAIAGRMIVGRSILAAVGRSYLDAADAHACCPWNKSIQIGLNSDPAMYDSVFAR